MFYWYSIFYIFLTIIIGQLLIDQKLKIIFFLVMFLLYVSCYNIYITFQYYIKLRNNPGIKGDRGDPGGRGTLGSDGVCSMAKNCGISNCRKLITDTISDKIPDYNVIRKKQRKNIELNSKEKKQLGHINQYIDILIPQCESYNSTTGNSIDEFKNIVKKTIS
jgi:hypothetical protein